MSHRVDIWDSFESYTQELRGVFEAGDDDRHWSDEVLEVDVWRRVDPDYETDAIVEFLLACGGPTVRVTVHPRDGVEFFHSWGMNPSDESNETTLFAFGDDAEFWESLAGEAVELS